MDDDGFKFVFTRRSQKLFLIRLHGVLALVLQGITMRIKTVTIVNLLYYC